MTLGVMEMSCKECAVSLAIVGIAMLVGGIFWGVGGILVLGLVTSVGIIFLSEYQEDRK